MIMRTHLAIAIGLILYFLPHVSYRLVFVPVLLFASLIPDIDSAFSFFGRKGISKPVQFFVKHRGLIHSFTACFLFSLILVFVYPISAFAFFLGYGVHLFADSFTVEGIRPFWPLKLNSKGMVRTGSRIEDVVLVIVIIFDVLLFVRLFM